MSNSELWIHLQDTQIDTSKS